MCKRVNFSHLDGSQLHRNGRGVHTETEIHWIWERRSGVRLRRIHAQVRVRHTMKCIKPGTYQIMLAVSLTLFSIVSFAASTTVDIESASREQAGYSITMNAEANVRLFGAGDTNGDGRSDVIIRTPDRVFVLTGNQMAQDLDESQLDAEGFEIGHSESLVAGPIGDFNGDGLSDIVVSARSADPLGRVDAGRVAVVLGSQFSADIDLESGQSGIVSVFGVEGATIIGGAAGDVNADGFDDLVVCGRVASKAAPSCDLGLGAACRLAPGASTACHVISGSTTPSDVDLASDSTAQTLTHGFIDLGSSVGYGAGDVNGDGRDDLLLFNGYTYAFSRAFVVTELPGVVLDLEIPSESFSEILYEQSPNATPRFIRAAGDVNGDGRGDIITNVGYQKFPRGLIVFGRPLLPSINTLSPGADVMSITLPGNFIQGNVHSLAGIGDVNTDGFTDIAFGLLNVGSPDALSGETWSIFGSSSTEDQTYLSLNGTRYVANGDHGIGASVDCLGDLNGDGVADFGVGSYSVGATSRAYVVFGTGTDGQLAQWRSFAPPQIAPVTGIGESGTRCNHGAPDSRAWIGFANGAGPDSGASLQTVVRASGDPGLHPDMFAMQVYWILSSDREGFSSAGVRFRYTDEEVLPFVEETLVLNHSMTGLPPWTAVPATVDLARNTIEAEVTSLGTFAISGTPQLVFDDSFENQ